MSKEEFINKLISLIKEYENGMELHFSFFSDNPNLFRKWDGKDFISVIYKECERENDLDYYLARRNK